MYHTTARPGKALSGATQGLFPLAEEGCVCEKALSQSGERKLAREGSFLAGKEGIDKKARTHV
jgi:hypothetical protein